MDLDLRFRNSFFHFISFSVPSGEQIIYKKTLNQGELNNAPAVAHPRNSDSFSRATPVTHSYDVKKMLEAQELVFLHATIVWRTEKHLHQLILEQTSRPLHF